MSSLLLTVCTRYSPWGKPNAHPNQNSGQSVLSHVVSAGTPHDLLLNSGLGGHMACLKPLGSVLCHVGYIFGAASALSAQYHANPWNWICIDSQFAKFESSDLVASQTRWLFVVCKDTQLSSTLTTPPILTLPHRRGCKWHAGVLQALAGGRRWL